eukprot:COSAG06_NODE_12335_length_1393_cov_1.690108_2_plen_56_part_00
MRVWTLDWVCGKGADAMDLELEDSTQGAAAGVGTAYVWGENSSGQLLLPREGTVL